MSNNYVLPIELPLSRGGFDFFEGPAFSPPSRYAVWTASNGVLYGVYTGQILDDSGIQNPFGFQRPAQVSGSFDTGSNLVLAASGSNLILIGFYQLVNNHGDIGLNATGTSFEGISAVLCNNSKAVINPINRDVVCFYLKSPGNQIFARFGLELYGTEHVLNASLPVNLARLIKAEILQIGGTFFQILWAETTDGRFVYLKSSLFPAIVGDDLTLDAALEGTSYFVPVTTPTISDAMTDDATLISGSFSPTVLTVAAPSDSLTDDASLQSGLYQSSVLNQGVSDSLVEDVKIQSGSYA